MKNGYKLVSNGPKDRLESFSFMNNKSGVEYAKETPSYPRTGCGPLCVFNSLEIAKQYIRDMAIYKRDGKAIGDYGRLFTCSYEPSDETGVWFLTMREGAAVFTSLCDLPNGTCLAKSVTLIEELPLEEEDI